MLAGAVHASMLGATSANGTYLFAQSLAGAMYAYVCIVLGNAALFSELGDGKFLNVHGSQCVTVFGFQLGQEAANTLADFISHEFDGLTRKVEIRRPFFKDSSGGFAGAIMIDDRVA
jgi:hypothetical protein